MSKPMKTNSYQHNGLNHRVRKIMGSETRLFYFNCGWQCVEEYKPGCNVRRVFGLRYADDLIYHQRGDTRYAMHDANWNVVAMFNTTSNVIDERYTYSAFGWASAFDAAFTARTAPSFYCDAAFTGQLRDYETGLMLYRNRVYHPTLGRFVQRDPIGYEAKDENLYRYVGNNSLIRLDPTGLKIRCIPIPGTGLCRYVSEPEELPKSGSHPLPTSPNAQMNYLFCCAESRDKLAERAGGYLEVQNRPSGLGATGADAGNFVVSNANDGKYHGVGGAETCVGVVVYCPDTDLVYAYHLYAGVNSGAALNNHSGCKAVLCGGTDDRGSRCLLESAIDTLRSQGVTLEGIIQSSGCYLGPDKKWYSELHGVK